MNRDQIMVSAKLPDMEKLKLIFNMDKDRLQQYFPSLYYAILAVLDEHKKPDASGYFGVQQPVTHTDQEKVMPFKLGTKLYHPVQGTPCSWEIKIEELKLTNKGWIINPDERYIWGCGIPVNKMEEFKVYLDEDGSIQKAHFDEFYANQSKYV